MGNGGGAGGWVQDHRIKGLCQRLLIVRFLAAPEADCAYGAAGGVAVGRAPMRKVRVISEPISSPSGPCSCQPFSNDCGVPGAASCISTSVVCATSTLPTNQVSRQSKGFSETSASSEFSGQAHAPEFRRTNPKAGRELVCQKVNGSLT